MRSACHVLHSTDSAGGPTQMIFETSLATSSGVSAASHADWLVPPLGQGVAPEMQWYPVITYLQVGMDLISGGEPPEVGHNYTANIGPAVALTINPEGWTKDNTSRLQAELPSLTYQTG